MNISTEPALRLGQGVFTLAGGIFAVVSVQKGTVLSGIPTAELGLALLLLGFIAAAGAEYTINNQRKAGLLLLATFGLVIFVIDPYGGWIVGTVVLFLTGIALIAISLPTEWIRTRLPI